MAEGVVSPALEGTFAFPVLADEARICAACALLGINSPSNYSSTNVVGEFSNSQRGCVEEKRRPDFLDSEFNDRRTYHSARKGKEDESSRLP